MARCKTRNQQQQNAVMEKQRRGKQEQRRRNENKAGKKKSKEKQMVNKREATLKKKSEAGKERMRKIWADPEKLEVQQQKERQKWINRKIKGQVKSIEHMNEREKRTRRKKVREWVQAHRKREKEKTSQQVQTENSSEVATQVENSRDVPSQVKSGRKKVARNKATCYKELEKLRKDNQNLKKKLARDKKAQQRKNNRIMSIHSSPNTALKRFIGKRKIDGDVKKRLLFGEVLKKQVQVLPQKNKDRRSKSLLSRILHGKIVQKYRLLQESKKISPLFRTKLRRTEKLSENVEKARCRMSKSQGQLFVEKTVSNFFEKNSRICPGKKDTITRNKDKKQKMYLNDKMNMLYEKF